MRSLRAWLIRLRNTFRRVSDSDASAEIDSHLELHIADNLRAGMTPEEARRQALIALAGLQQAKERYRERRRLPVVDEFLQDLRFGARLLLRDRAFAMTAILVLGFGIGMSNTFFTIVNSTCLRGLTLDRPDRVIDISTRDPGGRERRMSYADLEDVRAGAATLAGIAAFAPRSPVAMSIGDDLRAPERVMGSYVSSNLFALIGEMPVAGRDFRPEDDRTGAPEVVILGQTVWRNRYGGDLSIIGRAIRVNSELMTVVGVMPDRSKFPNNTDIWLPLHQMPTLSVEKRDARALSVLGRLANRSTPAAAGVELEALAARLSREHPETNEGFQITGVPINGEYLSSITHPAWIAFVTVAILLLVITCANVANLLLMRSMTRSREFAVRASLGAARGRVVRQLLCESLLLALVGGALGVGLSIAGSRLLWLSIPTDMLPYWMSFTIDSRALAFITAVCVACSFLFGLAPALQASKADVNSLLKDAGRTVTTGHVTRRWTSVLLVGQFALGMIFLALIAFNVLGLHGIEREDPPMPTSQIATAALSLPARTYPATDDRRRFYDRLDGRLRARGGIASWSVASALPFDGVPPRRVSTQSDAKASGDMKDAPMVPTLSIGPSYFETLGVGLVRGRAFDDRDGTPGAEAAIVNQRFVEMYLPSVDPIGKLIRVTEDGSKPAESWLAIVGVSATIRQRDGSPGGLRDPIVYLPARVEPAAAVSIVARGPEDAATIGSILREEVRAIDPDLPVFRVMALDQAIREIRWNGRLSSILQMSISLVAVALGAIGLYAVTAYAVARRTQEIGVRMALGAQPRNLIWLTLRRAMLELTVGIVLGMGLVFVWNRTFYTAGPVQITDPLGLASAAAMLVGVAALACVVPVVRAMRVNPVVVLRYE